jgi:ubiquinone/menaquinone biosynthesis C-methylase UbiE
MPVSVGRFICVTRHPRGGREVAALGGARRFGGKDVLDIGTGDGRLAFDLARFARRVVAVDPQADAVERALHRRTALGLRNLDFRTGDAVRLDLGRARFDVAVFTWSL